MERFFSRTNQKYYDQLRPTTEKSDVTTNANKNLTLLRHAKSSWTNSHVSDHERPLNDRGKRDAPEMARRLLERSCIPDCIYVSSAVRALETASLVAKVLGVPETHIHVFDRLYLAPAENILSVVKQAEKEEINHLMVVGHNPGMETLGSYLAPEAMSQLPTTGIYHFDCTGFDLLSLRDVTVADGRSDRPKNDRDELETHKPTHHDINLVFQDFPKNR